MNIFFKKTGSILFIFSFWFSSEIHANLIISQYIETNSGTTPKGVELWNVSGATIDFSTNNLVIKKGTNGATPSTDYTLSSGTLFNGGVIVVGSSGDLATETTNNGGTHYTESFTFNGNDALEIYLGGTLTDMFGISGNDPGTQWSGNSVSSANQNIQLKSGIWSGDTDGWTDPSTRFETVSSTPVSNMTGFGIVPGILISGNSGFRMMSSPVAGQIYSDLLSELWTQGMTGADVTDGTANVWTLNVSGQSWTALTDISASGASQTAGTGFLVYVFDDTNWDGAADLPVSLSVSGTENSSSASLGSIADGAYGLAGNPYASTIDWDLVTKTNLSASTSVWDDAASGWKSWNGSSGSLTNGLIAPYQGFWVTASGGTGSITIETADKASSSGTFYRTMDNDSTGSVSFTISSNDYSDQTFMSFMNNGDAGLDKADAHKLMPLDASSRVVGLSYTGETALDIHNLPFQYEGLLSLSLDVMFLSLDGTNFVTATGEINLSWDLDQLPSHIELTLIDNLTTIETDLSLNNTYTFTTESKGSFSAVPDGAVGPYPIVGAPRFTLSVSYDVLESNPQISLPTDFALHPVYPNPFNPSATIKFDLPTVSPVSLNVYNVNGQEIKFLLQETLKPGSHTYTWEPQSLPSGVYFLKLLTPSKTVTQKVTFVK